MWLFKKKSRTPSPLRKAISAQLNLGLRQLGLHCAAQLSRYEQRLSPQRRKFFATLLCLGMGLLSMTFLYQGLFVYETRPPTFLSKPGISIPILPHLPDSIALHRQAMPNQPPRESPTTPLNP